MARHESFALGCQVQEFDSSVGRIEAEQTDLDLRDAVDEVGYSSCRADVRIALLAELLPNNSMRKAEHVWTRIVAGNVESHALAVDHGKV